MLFKKHNLKIRLVVLILSVLSALYLVGCGKSALKTTHPHRGAIQNSFTELAKTKLEKTYDIDMPLAGQLARIELKPGYQIKKGQLVAQLVLTPWQQKVREHQAMLATMQAYYLYERNEFFRQKKLKKAGFASESKFENSQANARLMLAQTRKAAADLKIARYNLKQASLYAPISGIVLNRYTEGGKWLASGTRLLKLGNWQDLEATSEVLTQQAQQLQIGAPVNFISFDNPTLVYGRIKRIDPAGFTKKSALGVDEQRVNVIVAISNPQKAHLGVGYRLQATFFIGAKKQNALLAPRFSVLQDPQGNFYVFKVVQNRLKKQIVKIGIATDREVEITAGLTEQDTIITQPSADLYVGMKV